MIIAGCDEAGKGDYFGYLVVACVCGEEEELKRLGLRDPKGLSIRRLLTLEKEVRKLPHVVVRISPLRYNRLHRATGGRYNLNEILGWMHAQAVKRLEEECSPRRIVIDRFASPEVVLSHLEGELGRKVVFEERAERHPAVAAAALLARAEFIHKQEALSRKAGLQLPRGSTHVRAAARELIRRHGREALARYAKLHFRITSQL
ncbi:ribonuclease HIII [Candidatus Pyrohabitans sp.]